MKHIYVAGPITGKDTVEFFKNINTGLTASVTLMQQGYCVYPIYCDFTYLIAYPHSVDVAMLKANSLAMLEKCDAMILLPGWVKSAGACEEARRACELNIPIYYGVRGFLDAEERREIS